MGKLQYGSFYKFIVSIGVLLIVTPVFVVHFWMAGTYDQKILQQDFEALAPEAAKFMSKKMIFANMLISMLPLLFIITETAGITLLIWGCYKWHIAQKDSDRSSELEGRGKSNRLRGTTPIKENKWTPIEAERLYFNRLKRRSGNNYEIQQKVKIDGFICDIIAYSKKDNIDIIYEIKCWDKASERMLLNEISVRMEAAGASYEASTHREQKSILVIVSNAATIERIKKQGIEKTVEHRFHIEIEYIEESALKRNGRKRMPDLMVSPYILACPYANR